MAHFLYVRFLRDEHDILWNASRRMDLRRLAELPTLDESEVGDTYEDMKEQIHQILIWMKKGGVPDVPSLDVVYAQAMM